MSVTASKKSAAMMASAGERRNVAQPSDVRCGADVDDVVGAWTGELADFDGRRRSYLLYGKS
ncbi:hypothetical protein ABZ807_30285 [Micromonospora sp. NPDC047548]|uniref:hypothetical protein n=1 Tax=Micromonospora sp. NPDC047548 TaxID=3155624 RepID=UPI0033ECA8AD